MKIAFVIIFSTLMTCSSEQLKQIQQVIPAPSTSSLQQEEVISGIKAALKQGAELAVNRAGSPGGFNNSQEIRIPFPPQAEAVKDAAVNFGLGSQVESFESHLNEAAKAASSAKPILIDAIVSMSVSDGLAILNGGDTAATSFLRRTTSNNLHAAFKPIAEQAIADVELTKYWNPLTSAYNKNPFKKQEINTDLADYVTNRGLDGLFQLIRNEEQNIRNNPLARSTDLLKKVFGN